MDPQVAPEPQVPVGAQPPSEPGQPETINQGLPGSPFGSEQVNLPNYKQRWNSGESGPGLSPRPSSWDKFLTDLQQSGRDSFTGSGVAKLQSRLNATGETVPADMANKINPYRDTPYVTPVDSGVLAMEAADGKLQFDRKEWMSRNDLGGYHAAAAILGGFADAPLYMALGAMTGGIGDVVAGGAKAGGAAAAGVWGGRIAETAARYGWNLGEFATVGQLTNKMNASMGAKEESLGQVVKESMFPALIGTGLHALFRKADTKGELDPEAAALAVKRGAGALANDERLPDSTNPALADRQAGVAVDPNGNKILPTIKTSPLEQTKLYGASHIDGMPQVHESGLGPGRQFTDSQSKANNAGGQIGETKLPGGSKLLDIDRPAGQISESAAGVDDEDPGMKFLREVQAKAGVPLEIKPGESIKEVLTNLGDWAGAKIDGKTIPEDILAQAQQIAKEQGYSGYEFAQGNTRQAHVFDPESLKIENQRQATPEALPDISHTEPVPSTPEEAASQERAKSQAYDPNIQNALHDISKTSKTLHPDDVEKTLNETNETLANHKQILAQMAKENPELASTIEKETSKLQEQEVENKRLLDMAKKIMGCDT